MSRNSSFATSTSSTLTSWRMRATFAAVSVTIRRLPWTTRLPPWTNGRRVAAMRSAGAYWSGTIWVITSSSRRVGSGWAPMTVGRGRSRAAVRRQDLVEIAGADRRDAVDLEHRQEDVEDLVLRDAARGLDRHLLPGDAGADRVVEAGDLARRLDDGLDVGVVEVEHDLPTGPRRRGDRPTGDRLGRCAAWRLDPRRAKRCGSGGCGLGLRTGRNAGQCDRRRRGSCVRRRGGHRHHRGVGAGTRTWTRWLRDSRTR